MNLNKTNILIVSSVLLFSYEAYASFTKQLTRKLTGYIEVTYGCEIKRLHFPSLKDEVITKDCDIHNYALTPDGNNRIVQVEAKTDKKCTTKYVVKNKEKILINKNEVVLELSVSPHADKIAYLLSDDTQANKDLWQVNGNVYVINSDGTGDERVFDYPAIRSIPSWFPDNQRIAVSSFDYEIFIINTETNRREKIINFGIMPSVSPDGKKVAYLSNDVPIETQKEMIKYNKISKRDYLAMMKDKSELYTQSKYLDIGSKYFMKNSIYIYDIESKTSKKISKAKGIEEPVLWSKDGKFLIYNDRLNLFQARQIYVIEIATGKIEKPKTFTGILRKWVYD